MSTHINGEAVSTYRNGKKQRRELRWSDFLIELIGQYRYSRMCGIYFRIMAGRLSQQYVPCRGENSEVVRKEQDELQRSLTGCRSTRADFSTV